MNCPIDATTLVMTARSGVEIDHCPTCRGVWLDRDQLDRIIERVEGPPARSDRRSGAEGPGNDDERPAADGGERRDPPDDRRGGDRKRTRKGLLGELFELD